MQDKTSEHAPTDQFYFDINKISLQDLKELYSHFQIEDFAHAETAMDKESFFKCFTDGDTDGNKDAFLLIRLAAMFAAGAAKIIEEDFQNPEGDIRTFHELGINVNYITDFDAADYFHFAEEGFHIVLVCEYYNIEAAVPLLSKYNFLKHQIFFHG